MNIGGEICGDNRDNLIQKNVKLVQSGHFRQGIEKLDNKDIKGIPHIINLDYMGSSEFEWGRPSKSLRRMALNSSFYKVYVFNEYKDEYGNPLKVYAPEVFYKNIKSIVDRLVIDGYGLQEYCTLHKHIAKETDITKDKEPLWYRYWISNKDIRNFWWDIENDFFIFFEHTDKVIAAMKAVRKAILTKEKSIPKRDLRREYLRVLTLPNTNRFMDFNTSIKECYYDRNSKVHYIEFLETANLETILLEALIIAKTSKGKVCFNINGVEFNIDENTLEEQIINDHGIDTIDTRTYSDKIEELISYYNEELLRKNQKQLVHVLKLVKDKR